MKKQEVLNLIANLDGFLTNIKSIKNPIKKYIYANIAPANLG